MKYLEDVMDHVKVSQIGMGTGRFGTKVPEELSFEMLDLFYDRGGTLIDTARNYYEWVENGRGKSEECIGRWLKKRGNRESICLCTKCGVSNKGNEWFINLSRNHMAMELEESLEALGTDYIDIYLLHRDEVNRPVEEIIETMQYLKEKGNIKVIGVANWTYKRLKAANDYAKQNNLESFRIVQTWWSLAEYKYEMWDNKDTTWMTEDMYQYMCDENLPGMAYTSQCKGFFQKAVKNGLDSIDDFLKYRIVTDRNLKKLEYIEKYCQKYNVSPTAFVSSYITSNRLRGIALVSCSNTEQLEDILDNCDYNLPQKHIQEIDSI